MKSNGVRHTKAWTVDIVVSEVMSVGDPQGPNHNKGENCGVPRRKSSIRRERVKPHVLVLATGPEVRREKLFQRWHGSCYLYSSLSSTLH